MRYRTENAVSSFFYYMWNTWSKEECEVMFGGDYLHFWEKWNVQAEDPIYGVAERFHTELSECSRILLVERAASLYDGRVFRKESDDSKVLVCEECGSKRVETQAWTDASTEIYICDTTHSYDGEWYEECEENVDFCSLEELKQIMQNWWTGNDIGTLEGIIELKETDYLPNNSSQTFTGVTDK